MSLQVESWFAVGFENGGKGQCQIDINCLASFPIMFKSESLEVTQHGLIRTVTYNEFLVEIKSDSKEVNVDPKIFTTHSFR